MSKEPHKHFATALQNEIYTYNSRIVEQMNEKQIIGLLDTVFRNQESEDPSKTELLLYHDPSVSSELTHIYRNLSPEMRSTFESAVLKSIQLWNPQLFSDDEINNRTHVYTIESLLSLAASLRLIEADSAIFALLRDNTLLRLDPRESNYIRTKAISVLGGFAASKDISSKLQMLLYDERYAENSPTLLVVLSKSDIDNYPVYLSRFFDIMETHPEYSFDLERIFLSFSAVVPPEIFEKHLHQFPDDYKIRAIQHLCESEYSPYKFETFFRDINEISPSEADNFLEPETIVIKYRNPELYPTYTAPQSITQTDHQRRSILHMAYNSSRVKKFVDSHSIYNVVESVKKRYSNRRHTQPSDKDKLHERG